MKSSSVAKHGHIIPTREKSPIKSTLTLFYKIASGTTPPVTTTTTTTTPPDPPQTERYGLFRLDESEPINSVAQDSFDMAIVAVHGLNGDAYTSWEHENGTLWLRDLLPDTIPGARIFTYGYPSHLFLSKSTASLRDYSQRLLSSLNDVLDEVVSLAGFAITRLTHVCSAGTTANNFRMS